MAWNPGPIASSSAIGSRCMQAQKQALVCLDRWDRPATCRCMIGPSGQSIQVMAPQCQIGDSSPGAYTPARMPAPWRKAVTAASARSAASAAALKAGQPRYGRAGSERVVLTAWWREGSEPGAPLSGLPGTPSAVWSVAMSLTLRAIGSSDLVCAVLHQHIFKCCSCGFMH